MTAIDRLVDRIIDDRCTADPCASQNGLKTRIYISLFAPLGLIAGLTWGLDPGLLRTSLLVIGVIAFYGWYRRVTKTLEEREPCDEINSHYGESDPQ